MTLGKCKTNHSTVQTRQCESETSEPFDPAQTLTDSNVILEEDANELDIRVTHVLDVEHFWAQLGTSFTGVFKNLFCHRLLT